MKILSPEGKDLSSWESNGVEMLRRQNEDLKNKLLAMRNEAELALSQAERICCFSFEDAKMCESLKDILRKLAR